MRQKKGAGSVAVLYERQPRGCAAPATHLVSLQGERSGRHSNMTPHRSSLHIDNAAIHHNADRARRVCVSLCECEEWSTLRNREKESSCANFNGKLSFFALENPGKERRHKQQTDACQKTAQNGQRVIALVPPVILNHISLHLEEFISADPLNLLLLLCPFSSAAAIIP